MPQHYILCFRCFFLILFSSLHTIFLLIFFHADISLLFRFRYFRFHYHCLLIDTFLSAVFSLAADFRHCEAVSLISLSLIAIIFMPIADSQLLRYFMIFHLFSLLLRIFCSFIFDDCYSIIFHFHIWYFSFSYCHHWHFSRCFTTFLFFHWYWYFFSV